jgi:hypothetical protein
MKGILKKIFVLICRQKKWLKTMLTVGKKGKSFQLRQKGWKWSNKMKHSVKFDNKTWSKLGVNIFIRIKIWKIGKARGKIYRVRKMSHTRYISFQFILWSIERNLSHEIFVISTNWKWNRVVLRDFWG